MGIFSWIRTENNTGEYRKFGGTIFYLGWKVIACILPANAPPRIEHVTDNKDDSPGCGCGTTIFVEPPGGTRGNGADHRECGLSELSDPGRSFLTRILLSLALEIGQGE